MQCISGDASSVFASAAVALPPVEQCVGLPRGLRATAVTDCAGLGTLPVPMTEGIDLFVDDVDLIACDTESPRPRVESAAGVHDFRARSWFSIPRG